MNLKSGSLAALVLLTIASPGVAGGQRLTLKVSPVVAFAPASLTVRATVLEPSDDNRFLSIEVDSPDYRRSVEVPLDGKNAQRLNVVELKNVPPGMYEVKAVLIGPGGPIANTIQIVRIEPAAGHSR